MSSINVAIAEDHLTLRRSLLFGLTIKGLIEVVIDAGNGIKLMEKLECNPVDVVILDVRMPKMDGFDTLSEIKKKYPDTKVILFSLMIESPEVVTRAKSMGANSFVSKKDPETLFDAIQEVHKNGYYYNDIFTQ